MMNPVCTMVQTLPNSRPNIDAAKMIPAEVITPPVERTARMIPERMPLAGLLTDARDQQQVVVGTRRRPTR